MNELIKVIATLKAALTVDRTTCFDEVDTVKRRVRAAVSELECLVGEQLNATLTADLEHMAGLRGTGSMEQQPAAPEPFDAPEWIELEQRRKRAEERRRLWCDLMIKLYHHHASVQEIAEMVDGAVEQYDLRFCPEELSEQCCAQIFLEPLIGTDEPQED